MEPGTYIQAHSRFSSKHGSLWSSTHGNKLVWWKQMGIPFPEVTYTIINPLSNQPGLSSQTRGWQYPSFSTAHARHANDWWCQTKTYIYIHTQVCVYTVCIYKSYQIILCTYNKCIYICIYNIRIISYRIIVIVHVRHMSDMSYRPQAFQTPMWLTSRFCKWSCKVREVWGVWLRNQLWLY